MLGKHGEKFHGSAGKTFITASKSVMLLFVCVLLWIMYTNLNWLIHPQKHKLSTMSVDQIYIRFLCCF